MSDPAAEGSSKLVRNERVKLRATTLNGVALATIVAGFVTPLAAITFGVRRRPVEAER